MHLYICALQLLFSFFSNHFNQFSVVFYSTAPRPCIYSSTENSSAAAEKNSSAASLSLYRLVFAILTAYLRVKLRRDPTPPLLQRSSKLKRRRTLQTFSEFPYSNALRWLLLYFATLTRSGAVALPPSLWPSGSQSPMSNRGTVHALTALPKNPPRTASLQCCLIHHPRRPLHSSLGVTWRGQTVITDVPAPAASFCGTLPPWL